MTESQFKDKMEFLISFVKEAQVLRLTQQEYNATLNPILLPEMQAKERHFDQLITFFINHHLFDTALYLQNQK